MDHIQQYQLELIQQQQQLPPIDSPEQQVSSSQSSVSSASLSESQAHNVRGNQQQQQQPQQTRNSSARFSTSSGGSSNSSSVLLNNHCAPSNEHHNGTSGADTIGNNGTNFSLAYNNTINAVSNLQQQHQNQQHHLQLTTNKYHNSNLDNGNQHHSLSHTNSGRNNAVSYHQSSQQHQAARHHQLSNSHQHHHQYSNAIYNTTIASNGHSKKQLDKGSDEYKKRRERNNVAVRKSREKAKIRSRETERRVAELSKENQIYRAQYEELRREFNVLKSLLLKTGLTEQVIEDEAQRHAVQHQLTSVANNIHSHMAVANSQQIVSSLSNVGLKPVVGNQIHHNIGTLEVVDQWTDGINAYLEEWAN